VSKSLALVLLCIFFIAIIRLIAEGAWYDVAALITGLILAREHLQKLLDPPEAEEKEN
jgi:hypothetical protein